MAGRKYSNPYVKNRKTGKVSDSKTRKLRGSNNLSRSAEYMEGSTAGKVGNRIMLGAAAVADGVRWASGTAKGKGPDSHMGPAIRSGIKAHRIKQSRKKK
jgi:hypothetical protein